jgi:hypothetical protein
MMRYLAIGMICRVPTNKRAEDIPEIPRTMEGACSSKKGPK